MHYLSVIMNSKFIWKWFILLVLVPAKLSVSQSQETRERKRESRRDGMRVEFVCFLRKYLWRRLNAAGEIVSVRVWLWV